MLLQMNLILRFSTENIDFFVHRLPPEALTFKLMFKMELVQVVFGGGGGWVMTTKAVNPYDERLDGTTYINIIKNHTFKKNFKQNDRWYYIQATVSCHKSAFAMKWF